MKYNYRCKLTIVIEKLENIFNVMKLEIKFKLIFQISNHFFIKHKTNKIMQIFYQN